MWRESAVGSTPTYTVRGTESIFSGSVEESSISPRLFSSSARVIEETISFVESYVEVIQSTIQSFFSLEQFSMGSFFCHRPFFNNEYLAVSYTHLTLPTIYSV